ncbi:MAG: riboflavin biosynthesis protein RibF [Candidatus Omnitrophica bacterium]|nr:riboflavin biosynthesis protein RibF [Candidatus Omnitrophota bacterium]
MRGGSVVAIGIFDGVHRGHRFILARAVRRARALGATPVAVTFHPHPLAVLRPGRQPEMLLSLNQRLRLFSEAGIRRTVVIPFTRGFARWPADRFMEEVLAGRLRAREVLVGHDFCFGRARAGTVETLRRGGRRLGFSTRVIGPVRAGGRRVSSGEVRRRIGAGDLAGARRMLGRPPSVVGRVARGAGRGAAMGFPTANLRVEAGVLPPVGVYAVRARVCARRPAPGAWRWGMANLGYRPTFLNKVPGRPGPFAVLEVHLFGLRRRLYGKRLEVEFIRRLRAERRFPSAAALARQLARDASQAKALQRRRWVV